MKKRFLFVLCAALILALSLSLLAACSDSGDGEDESASDTSFESGTLDGGEHLAGGSESTSVVFPDRTESESPTDEPAEEPTELPTEPITEPITEPATEEPTEAETEPPVSLKYLSYGNGTCAVTGIGSYPDVYVIIPERSPSGDVVTAIEDRAFFENTSIKAVHIPSTVMRVGKNAFGGCSSLIYISVDTENMIFTDVDGILYSKDKTKLLVFPSANQASEIYISASVTEISDMAFFSTPSLKQIKYGGTLNDWSKIKIGEKNYGIYSASMTFANAD